MDRKAGIYRSNGNDYVCLRADMMLWHRIKRHCIEEGVDLGTLYFEAVEHALEHVDSGGELPADPSWDCLKTGNGAKKSAGPIRASLEEIRGSDSMNVALRKCLELHLRHWEQVRAREAVEAAEMEAA